ncbi:PspC domain-containing protein [Paenarthrobacter sp. DKR-5]|uniref:PspC domain-containing protein n=1 Tax=Paenarthrobacter sp. DKR-5 TaxID=2835535 RepID=UPI001BDC92CD|nr:PspC domain-containing protein [Paenarthrobacter sp. DKR-5]MBT1001119.1 PspC domain-containing protein [Paenarthrobacter sp. DKR-5]
MEKFFSVIRSIGLNRGPNRWIGGVCGGIAAKLNVDPTLVRIIFLVLALLPGPAVVFYILAWILLPDSATGRILLESWLRNKSVS